MKQQRNISLSKNPQTMGRLTVLFGPMYSGKTGKLIATRDVLQELGKRTVVIKPSIDVRFTTNHEIHSHDHKSAEAITVGSAFSDEATNMILEQKPDALLIDEAQFFDADKLLAFVDVLRKMGIDIVVGGLLYDYKRQPFGAMPALLGLADEQLKMYAVCQKCGKLAPHSERIAGSKSQIDVGAEDKYIAACQACHQIY